MKRLSMVLALTIASASLAACGGGGTTTAPVTPTVQSQYKVIIQHKATNTYAVNQSVTAVVQPIPSGANANIPSTWFVVGQGQQFTTTTTSNGVASFNLGTASANVGVCFFVGTPLDPSVNAASLCSSLATVSTMSAQTYPFAILIP